MLILVFLGLSVLDLGPMYATDVRRQTVVRQKHRLMPQPVRGGGIKIIIMTEYSHLSNTHVFVPMAIETGGTWHNRAVELILEIERRPAIITVDARESTFLFQQLSVALQRGNAVSFQNMLTASYKKT